jgi:hypothetical protein
MENGVELAKFLEGHPCVSQVFHPGMSAAAQGIFPLLPEIRPYSSVMLLMHACAYKLYIYIYFCQHRDKRVFIQGNCEASVQRIPWHGVLSHERLF